MTEQSAYLLAQFPIRKSKGQKAAFRDWLGRTLRDAGYTPSVEESRSLAVSHNVVVGDPDTAEVVLAAHYDTCAELPVPNLITPRNPVTFLGWQLLLVVVMCTIIVGAELLTIRLFDPPMWVALLVVYGVAAFLLWWMMAGKANKTNVNDNTSGVITLLETALSLPEELRGRVAFVFFDNEELGLLGSAGFYKAHKAALQNTLLLNFDCVGDGDHILFFPSKSLRKDPDNLKRLEEAFPSAGEKHTEVCAKGFSVYPSDQKHFPKGVGVAALHKSPWAGYWLGRIHTRRDTVLEEENVALLRRGILLLLSR